MLSMTMMVVLGCLLVHRRRMSLKCLWRERGRKMVSRSFLQQERSVRLLLHRHNLGIVLRYHRRTHILVVVVLLLPNVRVQWRGIRIVLGEVVPLLLLLLLGVVVVEVLQFLAGHMLHHSNRMQERFLGELLLRVVFRGYQTMVWVREVCVRM